MTLIWCFKHTWRWFESLCSVIAQRRWSCLQPACTVLWLFTRCSMRTHLRQRIYCTCAECFTAIHEDRFFSWNNSPVWIFLPTFWGGYFSAGQASQAPIQWRPLALWWKPNKDRNVDEASIFTQGPFFFALLHPRNLPEVPSVMGAFSSSLDVCGRNPTVARASKHLHFTASVSVHTLTYLDWVFVTFFSLRDKPPLVPSWAKLSDEEAVFIHAFTQMATVSHALCSEIETGI